MKAAVDTNVLLYAEGFGDARRTEQAVTALYKITAAGGLVPAQVCAELHHALTRKFGLSRHDAEGRLQAWLGQLTICSLTRDGFLAALTLSSRHSIQIFDAMILASAAESNCQMLLSEDMHDGFVWRGVTIVNPFAKKLHRLLKSFFDETA